MSCASVMPLATLAAQINGAHEAAISHAVTALQQAFAAGKMLREAKSELPHGKWLPWLRANISFSERTAQAYMRIERLPDETRNGAADLSVREALKVLARPMRKAFDDELAAWSAGSDVPRLPASDWTIDDARACAERIRDFDRIMHRYGICDGTDPELADCCLVCDFPDQAEAQP